MVLVYATAIAVVVLFFAVLLRRKYKAHYDYLVDCSFPKNGKWYSTADVHQYALVRDPKANVTSIMAALYRLRRKGMVVDSFSEEQKKNLWSWKADGELSWTQ